MIKLIKLRWTVSIVVIVQHYDIKLAFFVNGDLKESIESIAHKIPSANFQSHNKTNKYQLHAPKAIVLASNILTICWKLWFPIKFTAGVTVSCLLPNSMNNVSIFSEQGLVVMQSKSTLLFLDIHCNHIVHTFHYIIQC